MKDNQSNLVAKSSENKEKVNEMLKIWEDFCPSSDTDQKMKMMSHWQLNIIALIATQKVYDETIMKTLDFIPCAHPDGAVYIEHDAFDVPKKKGPKKKAEEIDGNESAKANEKVSTKSTKGKGKEIGQELMLNNVKGEIENLMKDLFERAKRKNFPSTLTHDLKAIMGRAGFINIIVSIWSKKEKNTAKNKNEKKDEKGKEKMIEG